MNSVQKKTSVVRIDQQRKVSQQQQQTTLGIPQTNRRMSTAVEGNLKLLETFELSKEVMSCRFNPDGDLLAVGLANGVIKVFSVDSKTCVYSIPNSSSDLPVTCLRWKPDTEDQSYENVLTATYASGDVKQWHVSSGKCLWTIQESRQVLTCSISSKAARFLTSGSDAKINLYDSSTRKLLNTFEASIHEDAVVSGINYVNVRIALEAIFEIPPLLTKISLSLTNGVTPLEAKLRSAIKPNAEIVSLCRSTKYQFMDGHTMRVFVVQFQPDNQNVFVSGGWDDTVQWWDVRQDPSHNIRKIVGPHICGEGLDIEPTSLNIVTGSWRKNDNIQVWDFNSGNLIKDVPSDFNRSMIYSVQWKNSDTIIAGGSHCNMMRFINYKSLSTTGRLMDLPGAVYTVDNNRQGSHPVVSVGCAETVYLVQST